MPVPDPAATRRSLHAVAELVLAGPQHERSGTIRLRVTAEGIATVAEPALTLTATSLVAPAGAYPLDGATCAGLATSAGVAAGAPADLYQDHTDVTPTEKLAVDPQAAAGILAAFARGDAALRRFAPDRTPVLWPEHFDVGITIGEVNYGVSPGDGYLAEPYAYVGPASTFTGEFWNAPFGAARPLRELPDDALGAFFARGAVLART